MIYFGSLIFCRWAPPKSEIKLRQKNCGISKHDLHFCQLSFMYSLPIWIFFCNEWVMQAITQHLIDRHWPLAKWASYNHILIAYNRTHNFITHNKREVKCIGFESNLIQQMWEIIMDGKKNQLKSIHCCLFTTSMKRLTILHLFLMSWWVFNF